jgi:hypothetical protein
MRSFWSLEMIPSEKRLESQGTTRRGSDQPAMLQRYRKEARVKNY